MSAIAFLKAACLVAIATGLLSLAAAHPAASAPWALIFDAVAWPIDGAQGAFSPEARLLNAISGAMLVGWGVTLYGLAAGPIARGDAEARRLFVTAVLVWFVLDCAASLAAGWPGNLVLNAAFLALLLSPLLALKSARPATA